MRFQGLLRAIEEHLVDEGRIGWIDDVSMEQVGAAKEKNRVAKKMGNNS